MTSKKKKRKKKKRVAATHQATRREDKLRGKDVVAISDGKLLTENDEGGKGAKWHIHEEVVEKIEDEKLPLWGDRQLGSDLSDWRGSN